MPASRFYSLPNAKGELSVEWMNDEIMTLVKSSMEHQEGLSYTFGKDIFLQPLDSFSTPPRYNLIYLNRTSGEATMLQDDNGFHIVYDPNITFQKNSDLIVQTEEFKINMDNAKQSRTHYIEDNTVTDSGITKKQESMLENYGEKLGMTKITSAESKLTSFESEMKEVDSKEVDSIDIWRKFYKTETKIVNGKPVKMSNEEIKIQKEKATKRLNNGNYKVPEEAKSSIDVATTIMAGQNEMSKEQLTKLLSDIGQIESQYIRKVQIGGGPARSYWQVEFISALDVLKQNLIAANEGRVPLFGPLFEKQFKYIIKGKSNTTVLKHLSNLSNSKMKHLLLDNSDLAATIALGIVLNRQ